MNEFKALAFGAKPPCDCGNDNKLQAALSAVAKGM